VCEQPKLQKGKQSNPHCKENTHEIASTFKQFKLRKNTVLLLLQWSYINKRWNPQRQIDKLRFFAA